MADYIPFVNSEADCGIVKDVYKDADICRVSLESIEALRNFLPSTVSIWLDPAVDAYEQRLSTKWPDTPMSEWTQRQKQLWRNLEKLFRDFPNYEILCNRKNWKQTHYEEIAIFVRDLLSHCIKYRPAWVTVPQLPLSDRGSRNKINKMLARATKAWKESEGFRGKLILPLIFTNQRQINSKPIRDDKLTQALECYKEADTDGIWVVDSTLLDQTRNEKFRNRYARLIEFHQLLKKKLPEESIKIGGPYWGINLILWARGLCERVAISLGSRYAYHISGGVPRPPSSRIAIPPLCRWVVINRDLRTWLDDALQRLNSYDPAYKKLRYIRANFDMLKSREAAKKYTALFYKHWFEKISASPQDGRALALYQDLSSAFVLGSQLPILSASLVPNSPASVRKSGKVAEQLMLNCL